LTVHTTAFWPIRDTAPRGTPSASARSPVTNCIVTYCPGRNRRPVFSTTASTTAVRAPWSTNGKTEVTRAASGGWTSPVVATATAEPTLMDARSRSPTFAWRRTRSICAIFRIAIPGWTRTPGATRRLTTYPALGATMVT
jgi:hypothetical protein